VIKTDIKRVPMYQHIRARSTHISQVRSSPFGSSHWCSRPRIEDKNLFLTELITI